MTRPGWRRIAARAGAILRLPDLLRELKDLVLAGQSEQLRATHPNPLVRHGRKCFSQGDEDGITLEILRRIGVPGRGTFAEYGVGDGTENNTLILAALGWKGFWVGGEALRFEVRNTPSRPFAYLRAWITLDNIVDLTNQGLRAIGADALDVISLDLDGNDLHFVQALLAAGQRPKLFIVEYNARFPPPVRFQIAYDARHTWAGDDYFGASLASFDDVFTRFGYRLVCCALETGANAFFVDAALADRFADVPADITRIYAEPRYYTPRRWGHEPSLRSLEQAVNILPAQAAVDRDGPEKGRP